MNDTEHHRRCRLPVCYFIATDADADAVYASAKASGARISMEIRDEDYGGREFSCHDLEGHLGSFGAYDPW